MATRYKFIKISNTILNSIIFSFAVLGLLYVDRNMTW